MWCLIWICSFTPESDLTCFAMVAMCLGVVPQQLSDHANAKFDESFSIFTKIFRSRHVDETSVDFLRKSGVGVHTEGF